MFDKMNIYRATVILVNPINGIKEENFASKGAIGIFSTHK